MPTGTLIRYDAALVEEAVLLRTRDLPEADQRRFRSRRDVLYARPDAEEREAAFEALHGEWFVCLGLDRPLHRALEERPTVRNGVSECRVSRARSRREEMADLVGRDSTAVPPLLALRLVPESFLDPGRLLDLLRREVLHVADMLDPAFGYERWLPDSVEGPTYDNVLRERYQALWATTVAGRLVREGLCPPSVWAPRHRDFLRAFAALGPEADASFQSWFDEAHPTHAAMVAYLREPGRSRADRCPVCRLPVAVLDPHPERLSRPAVREIMNDRPSWTPEQGLCPQCADLYLARGVAVMPSS